MTAAARAQTILNLLADVPASPYVTYSLVQSLQSNIVAMPADIQDMQDEIDDPGLNVVLTVAGTAAYGTIASATEATFTPTHTGNDRLVPLLVWYTGDSGAFAITEMNGRDLTTGAGALVTGFSFTFVSPVNGGDLAATFKVTALAANTGVAKTGTLDFYSSAVLDGETLVSGTLLDSVVLTKTYVAP